MGQLYKALHANLNFRWIFKKPRLMFKISTTCIYIYVRFYINETSQDSKVQLFFKINDNQDYEPQLWRMNNGIIISEG